MTPVETDDLIGAAREGSPEAWDQLYRLHAGRLLVWLRTWQTGDMAVTADDVAAESWMTAARRLPDFTGDEDDFGGWLFTIARKTVANHRRRSTRRATTPTGDEADLNVGQVDGPEVAVPGSEHVRELLAVLPPRERQVIACTEVVGLDVAATAAALGMTAVAVRVARHRGLRRLREALARPPQGGTGRPPEAGEALEVLSPA